MDIHNHARWLKDFTISRQWYPYPPFVRLAFMSEELGELAQAVRTHEIGRDHPHEQKLSEDEQLSHIREELADVLDNLLIMADKYGFTADDLMQASEAKLTKRFGEH
ncbi:MAG: MazG nucleotide pyrophosphohydrolase domain-containing protein [Bifidobacterium crudilactis]|uniref:MazG nucleotide pyrophosphohydrolase domain-containing protein n=1 Tax=Bifidobacterium crudilactis TaxID=327277 RepID=UPI003F9B6CA2